MLGGSHFRYQGGPFRGNVVGFSTGPGWSGGPLFNQQGEVCGLLDSSDCQTSVFISYAATREAYVTCRNRPTTKPTLYVFGSVHCGPCRRFKQHYADNATLRKQLDARFTVVFVDIDVHPGTADQFGIKEVPAFVVPGEPTITGYTEPNVLLDKLGVHGQEPERPAIVDAPPKPPVLTTPPVVAETPVDPTPPVTVTTEKPPVTPPIPPAAEKPDRSVADRLDRLSGLVQTGVSIATWLGVGGMTGGAGGLILGGLALWRTLRRRRIAASARDSPSAPTTPVTASPIQKPSVVTVESPPPPQAIVTETRFAPYERDTFAEAFAWAEAELVRKYPGSVSTLEAMKGLINQFLSAKGVKPK
jgi:thiol-disulfide isomerase/thioredoxin